MKFAKEAVRAVAFAAALGYPVETFAQKEGLGDLGSLYGSGGQGVELPDENPLLGAGVDACNPEGALRITDGERMGESLNGLRILASITANSARAFDERGEPVEGDQHAVDMVTSVVDCTPQDFDAAALTVNRLLAGEDAQYFNDVIGVLRQAYSDGDL